MIPRGRSITVDGATYNWLAKFANTEYIGSCPAGCNVFIQSKTAKSGQILAAHLVSKNWKPEHEQDPENLYTHKASLKPQDIENLIRFGLQKGWRPFITEKGNIHFKVEAGFESGDYKILNVDDSMIQ